MGARGHQAASDGAGIEVPATAAGTPGEALLGADPGIPRTVHAVRRRYIQRHTAALVVTASGEAVAMLPEHPDGPQLIDGAQLVAQLADSLDAWILATDDAGRLFDYLAAVGPTVHAGFVAQGTVSTWAPILVRGKQPDRWREERATFTRFGWRMRRGKTDRIRAWHMVLDPHGFAATTPEAVLGLDGREREDDVFRLGRLALWARDVCMFCAEAGLEVRPSRGGIAAQLLTDCRFWPEWRRKVPRIVNDHARAQLPGNHYQQFRQGMVREAREADQAAAHHQAAVRARFTDADTLYGRGRWRGGTDEARPWCRPTDPKWAQLVSRPGLHFLRVDVEAEAAAYPGPSWPWQRNAGQHTVAVWSEELPDLIAEPGVRVLFLVGSIASDGSSTALNVYGRFALDQLERANPRRRAWLKSLLLSVYGLMAQLPQPPGSFSTRPTRRSHKAPLLVGGRLVTAHVAHSTATREARYVNVADRGIIEAETRAESVRMARRHLDAEDAERAELIAIYADSVLYADKIGGLSAALDAGAVPPGSIPPRPYLEPRGTWKPPRTLTNLEVLDAVSWTADQAEKLPGRPLSSRERRPGAGDPPGPNQAGA